jgi:hypothetical protein
MMSNLFSQGQIVDAVIMPVAPHAAVIPGKYYDTGQFMLIWLFGVLREIPMDVKYLK